MKNKNFRFSYEPGAIQKLYQDIKLPEFTHYVRQAKYQPVNDVTVAVGSDLDRVFQKTPLSGLKIAVAVGSRGIDQIDTVVRAIIDYLKKRSAKPYIVAAMGSHGGAISEGQRQVLAEYGITEDTMGVEILTGMGVKDISTPEDPFHIYISSDALLADKIFVVNRVKSHTDFCGKHESGLMKLIAIGLGKHQGALSCHSRGFLAMPGNIEIIANKLLQTGKVLGGVGIVENEQHKICRIEAVDAAGLPAKDSELLKYSKKTMGMLPMKQLDALIVSNCGKEISGSGLDPLVTGRFWIENKRKIQVGYVVCSNLTDHSNGNAIGMGTADIICERLAKKVDLTKTYINGITSRGLIGAKIPLIVGNDVEAMQLCMMLCDKTADEIRIACIRDTNSTSSFYVSPALISEIDALPHLTRLNDRLIIRQGYIQI